MAIALAVMFGILMVILLAVLFFAIGYFKGMLDIKKIADEALKDHYESQSN